jgi:hypothetical protein
VVPCVDPPPLVPPLVAPEVEADAELAVEVMLSEDELVAAATVASVPSPLALAVSVPVEGPVVAPGTGMVGTTHATQTSERHARSRPLVSRVQRTGSMSFGMVLGRL